MTTALLLLLFLWVSGTAPAAFAGTWGTIHREDLELKQGRVDAGADAEAIEWEISVSDEWSGESIKSSETQHLSIKIFNTRGRDAFSRLDIPYSKGTHLADISARTIRPDGSVIEVKKNAFMDRTVFKGAGVKEKAVSFAMPGVEPGSVVEYRWTAVRYNELIHNVRVLLQLDIPVQTLRFSIHPLPVPATGLQMRIRAFNFRMPPFVDEAPGFHTMTIPSIPALKKEPFMPPDLSLRPWIAIYYDDQSDTPVDAFWRRIGKRAHERSTSLYRATGDVKKVTQSALAGVTAPDETVNRLVEYCRTRIRNSDLSDSGLTAGDREWLRSEHSASEYLKRGLADADGVLKVFLSMASAANLDARLALLPDRSECLFDSKIPAHYLLTRRCAAVQLQGSWRAVDPTSADLPGGMLPWSIEDVEMLVPDPENPVFIRTPISSPEQTLSRRAARLKLSEGGAVEGDVTEEIAGQDGAVCRRAVRDHSAVERETELTEQIKARMSTAEVSEIHFDPGSGPSDPFRLAYHIRVDGYAARTGRRLLLQPAFFQRGESPSFPARMRTYPVFFNYPWAGYDIVTIDLPAHFRVESPPDWQPTVLPKVGQHSVRLRVSEDGQQLQCIRSVIFGEGGMISFPVEEYPKLKEAFDRFHAQDDSAVSLLADETSPR